MNSIIRKSLAVYSLFGAFLLAAPFAAAADGSEPIGSIRPIGDVKAADLPGLAKISFQQALNAALAAAPGSVIKAELEVEDGNLMFSFEIVGATKRVTEVEIDAGNAKVLGTEDASAEAGKEKKS